ncbi:MAG: hypothetical protein QOF52_1596 [Propionibacteriaceae bacterium]|jgi:hypothetical protein|nr:hypothetical protein [Propionibacteriaceae bacterium]
MYLGRNTDVCLRDLRAMDCGALLGGGEANPARAGDPTAGPVIERSSLRFDPNTGVFAAPVNMSGRKTDCVGTA